MNTEKDPTTRLERMREDLAAVPIARIRRAKPDRIILIAATGFVSAGIFVILLGWYGAAHTPFVPEQIPYLLSGGLVGLALAVVGACLYVSYGHLREEGFERERHRELMDVMNQIHEQLTLSADSQYEAGPPGDISSVDASPEVVANGDGARGSRARLSSIEGDRIRRKGGR
jgi:hypothetical protein